MKEMSSVGKFRHGLPRGFVFAIRVLTFSQSEGESNGCLWHFAAGPPYPLIGRHQIGLSRLRSLSGDRWGNRPGSLWIAEDFGVLRFRLMVKRGHRGYGPQASEGEA